MSSRKSLGALLGALSACWAFSPACSSQRGKLDPEAEGGQPSSDGEGGTSGGPGAVGGEAGRGGSSQEPEGGAAGAPANDAGGAGMPAGGTPGTSSPRCVYHSDALLEFPANPSASASASLLGGAGEGGAGGAGGQAGASAAGAGGAENQGGAGGVGGEAPVFAVTVRKNAFVGSYLADSQGHSLYVFGADFAGDCNDEPVTNCLNECTVAWPIFFAGARALADGLDDTLFADIERPDGLWQTTYRGWPLYYYKNDFLPGEAKGQAVGLWHLAEVELPNIVLLRVQTQRFLATGEGRALYTFADDTAGTPQSLPQSACTADCKEEFPPFTLKFISPVSYLEVSNFTLFSRDDGLTQVAYKGAPLYLSAADKRSGDLLGATQVGWSAAAP